MSQGSKRIVAIGGVVLSVLALLIFGGVYAVKELLYKAPMDAAARPFVEAKQAVKETYAEGKEVAKWVKASVADVLQPRVTIEDTVVYEAPKELSQVVTATHTYWHHYVYSTTWGGSTKEIRIGASYTAKAGFALDENFGFQVLEADKKVVFQHSDPILISCEQGDLKITEVEGIWNKLQSKERENALNEAQRGARKQALSASLKKKAVESILKRLEPLSETHAEWGVTSETVLP